LLTILSYEDGDQLSGLVGWSGIKWLVRVKSIKHIGDGCLKVFDIAALFDVDFPIVQAKIPLGFFGQESMDYNRQRGPAILGFLKNLGAVGIRHFEVKHKKIHHTLALYVGKNLAAIAGDRNFVTLGRKFAAKKIPHVPVPVCDQYCEYLFHLFGPVASWMQFR